MPLCIPKAVPAPVRRELLAGPLGFVVPATCLPCRKQGQAIPGVNCLSISEKISLSDSAGSGGEHLGWDLLSRGPFEQEVTTHCGQM